MRRRPIALRLGFAGADYGYAIDFGLPPPDVTTLFVQDPEIKVLWAGPVLRPSARSSGVARSCWSGTRTTPGSTAAGDSGAATACPVRSPTHPGLRRGESARRADRDHARRRRRRHPGPRGLFVQDATGDGDPATSYGLFVFSSTAVAVGDEVAVTGRVSEFSGLTEIGPSATGVQRCGVATVPAPTTYTLPEPVDGDLERVEGMSVTIPIRLTVQQNFFLGRYGQLTLGSGGRRYQPTNLYTAGSPQAQALAADNARALLVLDDASSLQNLAPIPFLDAQGTRRADDTVTGPTGVLDQGPISSTTSVIGYRLQPTQAPAFASAGRARAGSLTAARSPSRTPSPGSAATLSRRPTASSTAAR